MNALDELTSAIDVICDADPAQLADRETIQVLHRQLERLDAATTRAARGLLAAGLSAGDRVAIQVSSGAPFSALYLGALRAGLIAVPVSPALKSCKTVTRPVSVSTSTSAAVAEGNQYSVHFSD